MTSKTIGSGIGHKGEHILVHFVGCLTECCFSCFFVLGNVGFDFINYVMTKRLAVEQDTKGGHILDKYTF